MKLPNGASSVIGKVNVGDVVCLYFVTFGENDPRSKFELPALFQIERQIGNHKYAYRHLATGEVIEDDVSEYSSLAEYMYRPSDVFDDMKYRRDVERKSHEEAFRKIKGERDLLRQILVDQGIRIVTEDQAKQLGLKA